MGYKHDVEITVLGEMTMEMFRVMRMRINTMISHKKSSKMFPLLLAHITLSIYVIG